MHVMLASMHHVLLLPFGIYAYLDTSVWETRFLLHRQCIDIRSQESDFSRSAFYRRCYTVAAHVSVDALDTGTGDFREY